LPSAATAVQASLDTRTALVNAKDGQSRPSRKTGDQVINGMISSATIFATLIIGLIAGPAVSL
jgi:hypothetical protein